MNRLALSGFKAHAESIRRHARITYEIDTRQLQSDAEYNETTQTVSIGGLVLPCNQLSFWMWKVHRARLICFEILNTQVQ